MFEIGDRVVAICDHPDHNEDVVHGCTGVVCDLYTDWDDNLRVGVRWDHEIEDGHRCNGKCEDGYGWYVNPDQIELEGVSDIGCDETELLSFLGVNT